MLVSLVITLHFAFFLPGTENHVCARSTPYHPRIHTFGNDSPIHAFVARCATKAIDNFAYAGRNIRAEIAEQIEAECRGKNIIDIGCGVGTLTSELAQRDFSDVTGIDTSDAMIFWARRNVPAGAFWVQHGLDMSAAVYDVAVLSFVMHEMTKQAHIELLDSVLNKLNSNGKIYIIDIHEAYEPSYGMLMGEPYLLDYLDQFRHTIVDFGRNHSIHVVKKDIVENHVTQWSMTLNSETSVV